MESAVNGWTQKMGKFISHLAFYLFTAGGFLAAGVLIGWVFSEIIDKWFD